MFPALAIAEQLVHRGRSTRSVAFVASRRPIDERILSGTDHPRLLLNVDGLQRSLTPRALWRTITAVPKLLIATAIATRQLRRWQPRVVVSVGGFASEPAVRAARALRIPVVVVSYDMRPGLATRRQAKKANAVAVAFAGSKLPGARHTGAPVRHDVRRLVRSTAANDPGRVRAAGVFGLDPQRRIVVAMGGSLGSQVVNAAIEAWVAQNGGRADVAVLHLTGERFIDSASVPPPASLPNGVQYVRRAGHATMAEVWQVADIAVCRAGASTIAELTAIGVPAVVVPWGNAADDHQRLNARWLADAGAAVVVDERDIATRFVAELSRLVDDAVLRERLAAKSFALGALNRSSAIGSLIEATAR
jgi:UDP-N-acetylglucosamine--N-acetylmuramyl-(pentapeptide) pyrophosphoryl-undecaprenol N-acetylglucosamine transferase